MNMRVFIDIWGDLHQKGETCISINIGFSVDDLSYYRKKMPWLASQGWAGLHYPLIFYSSVILTIHNFIGGSRTLFFEKIKINKKITRKIKKLQKKSKNH